MLDELRARDRSEQFHHLLGVFLGAMIYGLYLILFGQSMHLTWKNRSRAWSYSSKVFFVAMMITLALTTTYMGINSRRFLNAFTPDYETILEGWPPVYALRDYAKWDGLATLMIMDILVWGADALIIYRCFIFWGGNWWIIVVPVLLLLLSVVNSTLILVVFKHPTAMTVAQYKPLFDMTYPVNLSQNLLTTSLIVYKLWSQHRLSRAAGLGTGESGSGIVAIIRIIVESAMIFAFQHMMLMILYLANSPVQYVFHGTLVPSIGVALILIALRAYAATTEGVSPPPPPPPHSSNSDGSRTVSQPTSNTDSIAHYQNQTSMTTGVALTTVSLDGTGYTRSRSAHILSMQSTIETDKLGTDLEKGFSTSRGSGSEFELEKLDLQNVDSRPARDDDVSEKQRSG